MAQEVTPTRRGGSDMTSYKDIYKLALLDSWTSYTLTRYFVTNIWVPDECFCDSYTVVKHLFFCLVDGNLVLQHFKNFMIGIYFSTLDKIIYQMNKYNWKKKDF